MCAPLALTALLRPPPYCSLYRRMGRMLLDPTLDHTALISSFLKGYYGAAAPFVRLYMDTFHGAIADTDYYMRENFDATAAFLSPAALLGAKTALDEGVKAVDGTRFAARVVAVEMAVQYVALLRWDELRGFASGAGVPWPFAGSKRDEFNTFHGTATGVGVVAVNEGACDLDCYEKLVFA